MFSSPPQFHLFSHLDPSVVYNRRVAPTEDLNGASIVPVTTLFPKKALQPTQSLS